jgi:serine/threonine protein kinase
MNAENDPRSWQDDVARWGAEIDEICDEFDAAWRSGGEPSLEEFLGRRGIPIDHQPKLFGYLLDLELEYRTSRGERPSSSSYRRRFPSFSEIVEVRMRKSLSGIDPAFVGDYEIIEVIARGGMGLVFQAKRRESQDIVALKMIRPEFLGDSAAVSRFRFEATAASRLVHENIVPIHEVGEDAGRHYYVMRYVPGRSLAQLTATGRLTPERAARYIEQAARAVDYAHKNHVIHRDLKPSNIIIGDDDIAYVTDFGLAKGLEGSGSVTQTEAILGTLPYMAPEQLSEDPRAGVDSDVYSLGATLYEALTGRPPFKSKNDLETIRRIRQDEPTAPRKLVHDCPKGLELICLKCLQKERSWRYETAAMLADDLRNYLDGAPVNAKRASWTNRLVRHVRIHPTRAALLAVSSALVLAAFVTTLLLSALSWTRSALELAERSDRLAHRAMLRVGRLGERRLRGARNKAAREELRAVLFAYQRSLLELRGDSPDEQEAHREAMEASFLASAGNDDSLRKAVDLRKRELKKRRKLALARGVQEQSDLAETLQNLGDLLTTLDDPKDFNAANSYLDEAVRIRKALATKRPRDAQTLSNLARTLGYLGDLLRKFPGKEGDAHACYLESLVLRKSLYDKDPTHLLAKYQLARGHGNVGLSEFAQIPTNNSSAAQNALAAFGDAIALQSALVQPGVKERLESEDRYQDVEFPNPIVEYFHFETALVESYYYRALTRIDVGRVDEAEKDLDLARKFAGDLVKENQQDVNSEWQLARTLTELGAIRDDAALLDESQSILSSIENLSLSYKQSAARNAAARAQGSLRRELREAARELVNESRRIQDDLVVKRPMSYELRRDRRLTQLLIDELNASSVSR